MAVADVLELEAVGHGVFVELAIGGLVFVGAGDAVAGEQAQLVWMCFPQLPTGRLGWVEFHSVQL